MNAVLAPDREVGRLAQASILSRADAGRGAGARNHRRDAPGSLRTASFEGGRETNFLSALFQR